MPSNTELPAALMKEANGDWSVFKGTHYHLLYAAWALITKKTQQVTFYAGNDLLIAKSELSSRSSSADFQSIQISSENSEKDTWIQLKSDERIWTVFRILTAGKDKNNLLTNFIINALHSESQGRSWTATLVTPKGVDTDGVKEFVSEVQKNSDKKPKYYNDLMSKIDEAHKLWLEHCESQSTQAPPRDKIQSIALEVLCWLSESQPLPAVILEHEIELPLAYAHFDRHRTNEVSKKILGVLLNIVNPRPQGPRSLTLSELSTLVGEQLEPTDLLHQDPGCTCDTQVMQCRPRNWEKKSFARRARIEDVLEAFRKSSRTLFLLSGDSGTGKSWALANWATDTLAGRIRIWLSSSSVSNGQSLSTIVSEACKHFARAQTTEVEVFRLLVAASRAQNKGPFVLIIDDLDSAKNPGQFLEYLEELCRSAELNHTKIVISLRSGICTKIFRNSQKMSPYLYSCPKSDPTDSERPKPEIDEMGQISIRLEGATNQEIENILRLKFPADSSLQNLLQQLRHPSYSIIRNLHILSLFIEQKREDIIKGRVLPVTIDSLLDSDIKSKINSLAAHSDCESVEVRNALFKGLVPTFWACKERRLAFMTAWDSIRPHVTGNCKELFGALRKHDIISIVPSAGSGEETVCWTQTQIAARLTAQWLGKRYLEGIDILQEMIPGFHDEVMHALLRDQRLIPLHAAISLAWKAVRLNSDWTESVASGIALRTDGQQEILALLTAWSNEPGSKIISAMDSLATRVVLHRSARDWIASLFLDASPNDSLVGTFGMNASYRFASRWVASTIRLRVKWIFNATKASSVTSPTRTRMLRYATQPLQNIRDYSAAKVSMSTVSWVKNYSTTLYSPGENSVSNFRAIIDIDSIHGMVAIYDADTLCKLHCKLAHSESSERLAAAIAMNRVLSHRESDSESSFIAVVTAIKRENDDDVLMHLLTSLMCCVETKSEQIIELLALFQPSRFRIYGTVLCLLSKLAARHPARVRSLLPVSLAAVPAAEQAILTELLVLAWWHYGAECPNDPEVRRILEGHSTPNFSGLRSELRTVAARASAIAHLALCALQHPALSVSLKQQDFIFYPNALEEHNGYMYMDFDRLCRNADPQVILQLNNGVALLNRLTESIAEYLNNKARIIDQNISDLQWRIANSTIDWFCVLIPYASNPLTILQQIPKEEPVVRACIALKESGRASRDIIDYGRRIAMNDCDASDFVDDNKNFMALLSEQSNGTSVGIQDLDYTAEHEPGILAERLATFLKSERLVNRIWNWSHQVRHWRTVLLSRVYRVGFWTSNLSLYRCRQICEQMIAAFSEISGSEQAAKKVEVYRILRKFCIEEDASICSPMPPNSVSPSCDIESYSLHILSELSNLENAFDAKWFHSLFDSRIGWIQDYHDHIEVGNVVTTFSQGYSAPKSCYFFPEFRIALAIAGQRKLGRDFVPDWYQGWLVINESLSHSNRWRSTEQSLQQGLRTAIIEELWVVERANPHHISRSLLLTCLGNLLALSRDWTQAHRVLKECEELSNLDEPSLSRMRYDFSCALVGMGNFTEAYAQLRRSIPCLNMSRETVAKDEDFLPIRETEEFRNLLLQIPTESDIDTVRVLNMRKAARRHYEERFGTIPDEVRQRIDDESSLEILCRWNAVIASKQEPEIQKMMFETAVTAAGFGTGDSGKS